MAITSSISISPGAASLPDGYAPPALTPLTDPEDAEFETDIAISNAHASDDTVGLNAVLTAVKAYFDGTYAAGTLKLDVLLSISANLIVTRIKRVNTAASVFLTGTEVFRCTVTVTYK